MTRAREKQIERDEIEDRKIRKKKFYMRKEKRENESDGKISHGESREKRRKR